MNLQVAYQCFDLATDQHHILLRGYVPQGWQLRMAHSELREQVIHPTDRTRDPRIYSIVTGAKPAMQPWLRQRLISDQSLYQPYPQKYN